MTLVRGIGVFMCVVLLAGCAPGGAEQGSPSVTVSQVQERSRSILGATQEFIGSDGWEIISRWSTCQDDSESDLVRNFFFAQRLTSVKGDLAEISENVASRWESYGLHPKAQPIADTPGSYTVSDPPFLTGLRSDGSFSQLQLSSSAASLQLQSSCVEGDILELNDPSATAAPR